MITISLCMIVKNEEDVLERCLTCAKKVVDEIIIVDTGSTDKTKEIAKQFTNLVYDFEWIDDFSAARNFAFSKGSKDYLMWLDADDVILEDDIREFKALKQTLDKSIDIVMMKYNVGFDEYDNVTLSYYRERLLKNGYNYKWIDRIHEYIIPSGNIINVDFAITHKKIHPTTSGRNLDIYRKMQNEGIEFSPRNLFYFSRELYHNNFFKEAIEYYNKFIESDQGWIEDIISACYDVSNCYLAIGDKESSFMALLKSFKYATPRSEICCKFGYYFKEKSDYQKAVFWFNLAIEVALSQPQNGFVLHTYKGYTPYIEMCVCYDKLGNIEKAIECNEKAAKFNPDSIEVAFNREYFQNLNH